MSNEISPKPKFIEKNDDQWRKTLTPEQYRITREAGTEKPFSGEYWNYWEEGRYRCVGCGKDLFASELKFDAGCGWPSFNQAIDEHTIEERSDHSHGMVRTEVRCNTCNAHLGHVFKDGPQPTGLRYCINSAALQFCPTTKTKK